MSYCRWSSDNFRSDIYAYESIYGGYVTLVAERRFPDGIPELPELTQFNTAEWVRAWQERNVWLAKAETHPIGLPYDGQRFWDETLDDLEARLRELQRIGYRVPEIAFERIAYDREHPEDDPATV